MNLQESKNKSEKALEISQRILDHFENKINKNKINENKINYGIQKR